MSKSSSKKAGSIGASQKSKSTKSNKELFAIIASEEKNTDFRPGEEWQTATEIADEVGCSITTARDRLKSGVEQGKYERVKCGAWFWYRRV